MSALALKADMLSVEIDVRFVPKLTSVLLFREPFSSYWMRGCFRQPGTFKGPVSALLGIPWHVTPP
jgi:hypothetical protein